MFVISVQNCNVLVCYPLLMQRFYLDIEAIAVAMGKNPDAPVGLNKVTITL